MIIKRKKRYHWKQFWGPLIVEELGQFDFWLDYEKFITRMGAYLPSYHLPNYH